MKRFLKLKHERITLLMLLLFVVTLPLKNNLNSISIIALSVYSAIHFFYLRQFNFQNLKRFVPLLLFFFLSGLSIVYSEDKDLALKMVIRLLPFLFFPLIFSVITVTSRHFKRILLVYVVWMICVCLYSHTIVLIKFFTANDVWSNFFNNNYSYSSLADDTIDLHSTYYAYYVIVAIIFLLYFFFHEKKLTRKIGLLLALTYFSFFVLHLSARTPIVAVFLIYNFYILYFFFKKKKLLKGLLYLLLFYIITGIAGYNIKATRYRFQHIFGFTYYNGIHHDDGLNKLKQWEAGLLANQNFIFGNGIGDANNEIFTSYRNLALDTYAEREYNAHNQFIQTFVSLGLFGLVVMLFIFLFYFMFFYVNSFFLGYVLIGITFLLFQTESYLERHNGIVMFVFLICFLTNCIEKSIKIKST